MSTMSITKENIGKCPACKDGILNEVEENDKGHITTAKICNQCSYTEIVKEEVEIEADTYSDIMRHASEYDENPY